MIIDSHECEGCDEEHCPSRGKIEKLKPHAQSSFKKTIAIISGKGGVGKSMVSPNLKRCKTRSKRTTARQLRAP